MIAFGKWCALLWSCSPCSQWSDVFRYTREAHITSKGRITLEECITFPKGTHRSKTKKTPEGVFFVLVTRGGIDWIYRFRQNTFWRSRSGVIFKFLASSAQRAKTSPPERFCLSYRHRHALSIPRPIRLIKTKRASLSTCSLINATDMILFYGIYY